MSFPIESLPDEILINMFEYLEFKDLGRCLQVSKRFRKMALDEKLWKKIKTVDQGNLLGVLTNEPLKSGDFNLFTFL